MMQDVAFQDEGNVRYINPEYQKVSWVQSASLLSCGVPEICSAY